MIHNRNLLLLLLLLGYPASAFACSCGPQQSISEAFTEAEAVFLGEVTSFEQGVAHFKTERGWKGIFSNKLSVHTNPSPSLCGYSFKTGKRYLVYAFKRKDGTLTTFLCSRTSPADSSKAEQIELSDLVRKRSIERRKELGIPLENPSHGDHGNHGAHGHHKDKHHHGHTTTKR